MKIHLLEDKLRDADYIKLKELDKLLKAEIDLYCSLKTNENAQRIKDVIKLMQIILNRYNLFQGLLYIMSRATNYSIKKMNLQYHYEMYVVSIIAHTIKYKIDRGFF